MGRVYVVGTADTKGEELAYLAGVVAGAGARACTVDVGTREPAVRVDISNARIAAHHPHGADAIFATGERGTAVAAMTEAFARFMASRDDVAGVIGIGGGGGTAIITAGMRPLPYGVPKLMVSTLASGDVAPYVDISNIVMMPSVTDIAGLNRLSRVILHQAGRAIAAMAADTVVEVSDDKPAIGLSMFGVTTACVTSISGMLRSSFDCMVFHATGTGGRAMEKLADDGLISGIIDITTTEVCDLLVGGVLPATQDRFGAVARTGLPYVGSVGALDMVNFWAPDTVPEKFAARTLYKHNANVTLMRTNAQECEQIGRWIAQKLNACEGPVRFLIPEKGVSALDIKDGAFFDREADEALFAAIEDTLIATDNRQLIRMPHHINDPLFAAAAAATFQEIARH